MSAHAHSAEHGAGLLHHGRGQLFGFSRGPACARAEEVRVVVLAQYFMLGNITWNAWLFLKTNPSIRGVFFGGDMVGQGWRYVEMFFSSGILKDLCDHLLLIVLNESFIDSS